MSMYTQETTLKMQLQLAIAYLQPERVSEILDSMDADQFNDYVKNASYSAVHRPDLTLIDMPYTNLSRHRHGNQFNIVERLLSSKIKEVAN
jgi:hypothetical protein